MALTGRWQRHGPDVPGGRRYFTATLHYVLALILIACVAVTSHLMLSDALEGMDADGPVINASGRQRMLSEKTLRLAGELMVTEDSAEVARVKGALTAALRQMRSTHERLVSALERSVSEGTSEPELEAAFKSGDPSLDERVRSYFSSIEAILAASEEEYSSRNRNYLALQAEHSAGLVHDLDGVVKIYERLARKKIERFKNLEEWLLFATISLLFGEAIFIFRPLISDLLVSNERLEKQNRLMAQVTVSDTLTKLPNRLGFGERLSSLIDAQSGADRCAAIMMLDLDRFKNVNDKCGHSAGDRVLIEVGERISQQLREGDTVARLGGDEFAIILRKLASASDASLVAERIIDAVCRPIALREGEVSVGASIGITIFPDAQGTSEQLMKFADLALSQAKREGKGCYRFYDPSMQDELYRKSKVADGLKDAFDNGDLKVFLQPILSLQTGRVELAESLVRWDVGSEDLVTAADFIDVIDEFQMAPRLEGLLFEQVFSQLARWHLDGIDAPVITLNMSGVNLRQPDFCDRLARTVSSHGLTPDMIAIEILESALTDRGSETVIKNVLRLHNLGFALMLDDFGMGHTSLRACPQK